MTLKALLDPQEELYPLNFNTSFSRIIKADNRFLIAGYASPVLIDPETGNEMGDADGDTMDLDALDEALTRMMSIPSRRNLMGFHTNTQIGELIFNANDSDGTLWKTYVVKDTSEQYPLQGMFIVAELFQDLAESKRYMKAMNMGGMLSLSIGGESLKRERVCADGVCRNHVTVMDLHETSACPRGKNYKAKAFILKAAGSEAAHMVGTARDGAHLLRLLYGELSD